MANHENGEAQFKFWVISLVGLAQELVVVLTLGFIVPRWRGKILFSQWADR